MKKVYLLAVILLLSVTVFGAINGINGTLNVTRPGGVIAQPYVVRAAVVPEATGTYKFGLEGHLSLLGLNLSVGTTGVYDSEFKFDTPVYVGFGLNLGAIFASVSAKAENLEKITDLKHYSDLKVAFGLAGSRKTWILVGSWSRFELSYQPNNLLKLENGEFKLVENVDWADASARLLIESYENGYFKFEFILKDVKKALDGEFNYDFALALPLSPLFFVQVCQEGGNWIFGGGAALNFAKVLVTYEGGEFKWCGVVQF